MPRFDSFGCLPAIFYTIDSYCAQGFRGLCTGVYIIVGKGAWPSINLIHLTLDKIGWDTDTQKYTQIGSQSKEYQLVWNEWGVLTFSSYLTENIFCLHFEDQPVNGLMLFRETLLFIVRIIWNIQTLGKMHSFNVENI